MVSHCGFSKLSLLIIFFPCILIQVFFVVFAQLPFKECSPNLRGVERDIDSARAVGGQGTGRTLHIKILNGFYERRQSSRGERISGEMDDIRREIDVDRYHLRRYVIGNRGVHLHFRYDPRRLRLGSGVLHPRFFAVDLVRCVLFLLRRQSGIAEIHNRKGTTADSELLRSQSSWLVENAGSLEKHIHIGAVLGASLHLYLRKLWLVLFAHATALVHEQDTPI